MSVLDRAALDESPLADLHTIASELSIDGYRRLRRAELIDAIVALQSGEPMPGAAADSDVDEDEDRAPRRRRGRRGGRARTGDNADDGTAATEPEPEAEPDAKADGGAESEAKPRRRSRREEAPARDSAEKAEEDVVAEGVVELLANGSGFLRVSPPEPSDHDVYISGAQVKRCELVAGDRISGPRRAPRRSERFPSLVRIDTINGRPAEEVAEGARFDDLPAAFPADALGLDASDATLKAITSIAPFGKGSRVSIVGPPMSGKTEIVRALASALSAAEGIELSIALVGIRPEEISEWKRDSAEPAASLSFAASADAQANAVDRVIEHARRIAARGADVVVLIDTLEGLHPPAARKALAAARNIVDGGSVTVIATAAKPFGGETTVVSLDPDRAAAGAFPAIDPVASSTIRAELLVGEKDAKAMIKTRVKAITDRAAGQ